MSDEPETGRYELSAAKRVMAIEQIMAIASKAGIEIVSIEPGVLSLRIGTVSVQSIGGRATTTEVWLDGMRVESMLQRVAAECEASGLWKVELTISPVAGRKQP